jgi:Xaa-Pro aminopeptidase
VALENICNNSKNLTLKAIKGHNANYMAKKESKELDDFKNSFNKSDLAIWRTLDWARKNKTALISEINLKEKILNEFKVSGAWRESFHPICGFGANSAIIHYGQPSDKKTWDENEFLLLDSGAYYESGVATDTTRTLFNGAPNEKAVLMYSLVLRGLIKAQMSVFAPGTLGSQVDMLAREPLLQFGKNYAHGTGHGIGVHVHEAGYLLNPMSTVGLFEGQVGSIEPGYYEEGWGGIRLENAVVVVKHPTFEDKLTFESLTYIPFEEDLIDRSLFTSKELEYLDQYQEKSRSALSE